MTVMGRRGSNGATAIVDPLRFAPVSLSKLAVLNTYLPASESITTSAEAKLWGASAHLSEGEKERQRGRDCFQFRERKRERERETVSHAISTL